MFYISDYQQRIRKIHGAKCLMVNIPNARHAQWIEQYNDTWFRDRPWTRLKIYALGFESILQWTKLRISAFFIKEIEI